MLHIYIRYNYKHSKITLGCLNWKDLRREIQNQFTREHDHDTPPSQSELSWTVTRLGLCPGLGLSVEPSTRPECGQITLFISISFPYIWIGYSCTCKDVVSRDPRSKRSVDPWFFACFLFSFTWFTRNPFELGHIRLWNRLTNKL